MTNNQHVLQEKMNLATKNIQLQLVIDIYNQNNVVVNCHQNYD